MQQPHMSPEQSPRPSRTFLERRLRLLKRSVVVVAVGSFAAVASLAAARTAAHGASTPTQQQTNRVNEYQDEQDDYFASSPYGDDSGSGSSGSLGTGSGSAPAAGSHAS